ncbi:hypothetical protein L1987_53035 [Smallanthus sonchifolius]|uniref:Uncharacterized protein n=1 Tax=Smallanthus sonchifolius TaxID=185202 RepID=A0ACB9EVD1_9ASTR|nr:hypothetical protein L1987_53035 [Smallanthus sonchifolius]
MVIFALKLGFDLKEILGICRKKMRRFERNGEVSTEGYGFHLNQSESGKWEHGSPDSRPRKSRSGFGRQLVLQAQSTQIVDMQLLVSKLVEHLDAQGELRLHDTCHAESIQRKDNDDNDPSGNVEGDRQYADVNPTSGAQGESTSHTIEGTKQDSRVNEEILLLEFFQDSEEEEAEKLECLDDIDELFDDDEEDVVDIEVEEGEIVEIEIEKSKSKVTCEGYDGLNVPYNFIQDDVIPEFSYDGVTDSMDSIEDITTHDDTAQSNKIDSDVDTTHIVSPKTNEEPVMYRNTVRVVQKIPLKKIPQDFLGNMKWWYVDVKTGEARIDDKDNKVIVCFYDAMNLINFSKKDQRTLRKNEIMFTDEWREQGL